MIYIEEGLKKDYQKYPKRSIKINPRIEDKKFGEAKKQSLKTLQQVKK